MTTFAFKIRLTMSDDANDEVKLETAPFDARFPYTNQTKNCWQNFVDFHRCVNKLGDEHATCQYFKRVFTSLCPATWVGFGEDNLCVQDTRFL